MFWPSFTSLPTCLFSAAAFAGGTITQTSRTLLNYTSAQGYTVTLSGTGFKYGSDGRPTAGTVTGITLLSGSTTLATVTNASVALTQVVTLALGQTSGVPGTTTPNIDALSVTIFAKDDLYDGNELGATGYGFAGNDTMYGNGGDDWLNGGAGVDQYFGGSGVNGVFFNDGTPVLFGISVDLNLAQGNILNDGFGNVETATQIQKIEGTFFADRILGNLQANVFWGYTGNDTLIGGGGDDTLDGGRGDDGFDGGRGVDLLIFSNDVTLSAGVVVDLQRTGKDQILNDGYGNVEQAKDIEKIAGSSAADVIKGNNINNTFWGGNGNDTLNGGSGHDTLYGGSGNDSLKGALGNDHFGFTQTLGTTGTDIIEDFVLDADKIALTRFWAPDLVSGPLLATQFRAGAGVTTANTTAQRVIYDTTTGNLYFDADGTGGALTVKFAQLANLAALNFDDFIILG